MLAKIGKFLVFIGALEAGGVGMTGSKTKNPMWGGRFTSAPADCMAKINVSIGVDKRLYRQDIKASIAHAKMLAKQRIITTKDAQAIEKGLQDILKSIESGRFVFKESLEDIHMNVEGALKERIGEAAGRLHTARSRNDQVATDFRLYVRDALDQLDALLALLQAACVARAEEHCDTLMPGFTHLQTAQPITLGHHLMAYVEMFGRDRSRVQDARKRMNESPLGAAALAGTSYPIDRAMTAKLLGFDRPMQNSLDAVSDRDFVIEYLSIVAMCAMHLSRLAEEFIIWCSAPFSLISFSDAFSTGSSIMPQKRNPDAAELVRGKAGRIYGHLLGMLTMMKALPLAYNKDMQEDKGPLFDAEDTITLCLQVMCGMVNDFTAHPENMKKLSDSGYATATDLADWLVQQLRIPFREAHHITARIVALATTKDKKLSALSLKELQSIEPRITQEALPMLDPQQSIRSRTSVGGTAPVNVKKAIAMAKKRFGL